MRGRSERRGRDWRQTSQVLVLECEVNVKHFKTEAKWMIGIPLAVIALALIAAVLVPYFR